MFNDFKKDNDTGEYYYKGHWYGSFEEMMEEKEAREEAMAEMMQEIEDI